MIPLPPGCKVNFPIFLEVDQITNDIVNWFRLVGGEVKIDEQWDRRGRKEQRFLVRYGKGKFCYYRQDGSNNVRIHFDGTDATVASMFLLKFVDHVVINNLQEHMERQEQGY